MNSHSAASGGTRSRETNPIGKLNAAEFRWRDVCRGWTLVAQDALHVVLEEMPPGTHEVRHVHARTTQFYFVLRGAAVVRLGERTVAVATGNGVEILPRVPHQIRNESDEDLEFLVVSSQAPRTDRTDLPD